MAGQVGLSEKTWWRSCGLKNEPAHHIGVKKWPGAYLYVALFAIGYGLSLGWFCYKDAATFTVFEKILQGSQRTPKHRLPDLIICPSQREEQKYKYNAAYFEEIIEKVLAMPPSDVNELTGMIYDSCPENQECLPLDQKCEGTKFAKYCSSLEKKILGPVKSQYPDMTYTLRRIILKAQAKKEGAMSLQTLFGSLLMLRHMAVPFLNLTSQELEDEIPDGRPWKYKRFIFPLTHFYHSNFKGDGARTTQYAERTRMVFIGRALCTISLGHHVDEYDGAFYGIAITGDVGRGRKEANKQMQSDYWLGNLDVTTLDESQFVTNFQVKGQGKAKDRISGVVEYRMINLKDEAGMGKTCAPQTAIRGLKIPCRGKIDNVWWYYIFSYQRRSLPTIWTYPKSLDFDGC